MPNPRQMVVATLKELTKQCLREQMRLKVVLRTKAEIEEKEHKLRERIRGIKLRVNREVKSHGALLGVNIDALLDEDNDGEQWKEIA